MIKFNACVQVTRALLEHADPRFDNDLVSMIADEARKRTAQSARALIEKLRTAEDPAALLDQLEDADA